MGLDRRAWLILNVMSPDLDRPFGDSPRGLPVRMMSDRGDELTTVIGWAWK